MPYPCDRIGICLEQPSSGIVDIAAWRAAAETMRAALFLARFTYFTPPLEPLAATLARATARPAVAEGRDSDLPSLLPGDLLPAVPEASAEGGGPSFRHLSRYWSPEAFQRHAKKFDFGTPLDIWVALTPPRSDLTRALISSARRVVGFRTLAAEEGFTPEDRVRYLDAEWSPRRAADPESGKLADEGRNLPPFGLMLQSFGLRSIG